MVIKKLQCKDCDITVEGTFYSHRLGYLDKESLEFIEEFVLSRGNLKDMEVILNASYPTVKAKLDKIIKEIQFVKENDMKQL